MPTSILYAKMPTNSHKSSICERLRAIFMGRFVPVVDFLLNLFVRF